jgi:poly[(R)-3-hydroxyalkanoate] polymerase subunit PhaC
MTRPRPSRSRPGPGAPRRLGPRPLPLHLMSAMTAWLSSRAALPVLMSDWLRSKPECDPPAGPGPSRKLAAAARELAALLADVAPEAFAAALDRELRERADVFLRGLEAYRHHPYQRASAAPPVVWRDGTTSLLDYAPDGGVPVLVVPSLVNRAYILDLSAERSLLRYLARQGLRPLLIDWARPGPLERGFTLSDYIAGRLDAAFEAAVALAGAPLGVVGYCMGGLLALALAERRQREVASLALLATPWNFHAEQAEQARLLGSLAALADLSFAPLGELPVDVLQALFFGLDPLLALRKFSRFAALDPASAEAREFVALEDWLNDGVPLALPVARECLAQWYGANEPGRGAWLVAGAPVVPARFAKPALVVVPARDRIVPPASAIALATALPRASRLDPPLGHIGMIVGRHAEREVWQPLARWLLDGSGAKA